MSDLPHTPREELALIAARGILAEAACRPWLASILLRQRAWLEQLTESLTSLPRRFRRFLRRRLAPGLSLAALLLAMAAPFPARAGTIVVDEVTCTLENAIITANTGVDTSGCTGGSAGEDTIDLQADVTTSGPMSPISSEIIIEGNGYALDGNLFGMTLDVASAGVLTVNDLVFTNGIGAIESYGTLELNNTTITGATGTAVVLMDGTTTINNSNIEYNNRIGIYMYGASTSLNLNSSTVRWNIGSDMGSGLYVQSGNSVNINSSTFDHNTTPGSGGAIFANNLDSLIIANSTISQNQATGNGGGLSIGDLVPLTFVLNSTLYNNTMGASGGAIYAESTVFLQNSILSSTADDNCAFGPYGSVFSYGYNIETGNTCTLTGSDLTNETGLNLQALDNNGTVPHPDTHALLIGSTAIDFVPLGSGCDAGLSVDERGGTRAGGAGLGGAACDAGAYEYDTFFTPTAISLKSLKASPAVTTGQGAALAGLGAALAAGWAALRRKRSA